MRYLKIVGPVLGVTFAFCLIGASTALARCAVVSVVGTGRWEFGCRVDNAAAEVYIKVKPNGTFINAVTECAEVETYEAGERGTYTEEDCVKQTGEKRWIKVSKPGAGPFFKVGEALVPGETRLLLASAHEKFTIEAKPAGEAVNCESLSLRTDKAHEIANRIAGLVGLSHFTILYTGCSVTGNGEGCEVEGKMVTTGSLLGTDGFSTASGTAGPLLVLLEPESGKLFATIKFTGAKCTVLSTGLTGNVIGAAFTTGKEITAEHEVEAARGELHFTKSSKAIWTEVGGTLKETKAKLEVFGLTATLSGAATVDLGGGENWGEFS